MNTAEHPPLYTSTVVDDIVSFLEEIGIGVKFENIQQPSFLPGIHVDRGTLLVDRDKLLYPGDLLHEAGHIAVMTPEDRASIAGDIGAQSDKNKSDGEEIMAITWSYAACTFLGIDPSVLFHAHGYKGASNWYIQQFSSGSYIGLPLLQWIGLCKDARAAEAAGVPAYPHMLQWLRQA